MSKQQQIEEAILVGLYKNDIGMTLPGLSELLVREGVLVPGATATFNQALRAMVKAGIVQAINAFIYKLLPAGERMALPLYTQRYGDLPTARQYKDFVSVRAAALVRDKLVPAFERGHVPSPGFLLRDYLLRQTGKEKLNQIGAGDFERLLAELEAAPPSVLFLQPAAQKKSE
jgi:hypothetical protein